MAKSERETKPTDIKIPHQTSPSAVTPSLSISIAPRFYITRSLFLFFHHCNRIAHRSSIFRFGMELKRCFMVLAVAALMASAVLLVAGDDAAVKPKVVKVVKGKKLCTKGWECKSPSVYCCNQTISDYFQAYQFENLFSKRNAPVAHAAGFWDYHSFITAAADYQPLGFGTTGGKLTSMKEVAAFLGHVGSKTSCESSITRVLTFDAILLLAWYA